MMLRWLGFMVGTLERNLASFSFKATILRCIGRIEEVTASPRGLSQFFAVWLIWILYTRVHGVWEGHLTFVQHTWIGTVMIRAVSDGGRSNTRAPGPSKEAATISVEAVGLDSILDLIPIHYYV